MHPAQPLLRAAVGETPNFTWLSPKQRISQPCVPVVGPSFPSPDPVVGEAALNVEIVAPETECSIANDQTRAFPEAPSGIAFVRMSRFLSLVHRSHLLRSHLQGDVEVDDFLERDVSVRRSR